ncbi:MAG TPA: ABC transporter permease subunit, partial [Nitrospiraceae bacterium]|nr:ABC transporter permease subunit [Nitrospiraceae bacterium]
MLSHEAASKLETGSLGGEVEIPAMPCLVPDAFDSVRQNLSSRRKQFWIELVLGAIGLSGAVIAWWYQRHLNLTVRVGVWSVLILVLAILARKGWVRLFGPVLFYDAIRTGRRSRYVVLRSLYAIAFLLVMYWTYTTFLNSRWMFFTPTRSWPKAGGGSILRQAEAAALAASFFYNAMKVQFLALIFFTPAYVAGAIAEEKERKTMEFLLATDLDSREIVLSKLFSRLGSLALLVMTGLPILSILQLMGGIDPNLVVAGFLLTGLSMISLAAVSILVSVYARKQRAAIVVSYLILVAYLLLASSTSQIPPATSYLTDVFNSGNILAVLPTLEADVATGKDLTLVVPGLVRNYALFHIVLAVVCVAWAVARLRTLGLRHSTTAVRPIARRAGFRIRPRVGGFPVIWKEVFVERGLRLNWIGWLCFFGLLALSFYLFAGTDSDLFDEMFGRSGARVYRPQGYNIPRPIGWSGWTPPIYSRWHDLAYLFNPWFAIAHRWSQIGLFFSSWVRVAGTIVASLMLVGVAVRGSSSISGERDRETLDGLLTSPLQSHDILFGKWLGSLLSVRGAWFWLGLIWGIGLSTGGLHPASVMLTFGAWLVYASCLAGVGIWFSISCRTTLRATLYTLAFTFAASFGHWLIWLPFLPYYGRHWSALGNVPIIQASLTPPAVLYSLSATSLEVGSSMQWEMHTILAGFGLFAWAMAACIIWSITR